MVKKTLSLMLILMLAFTITSCSDSSESQVEQGENGTFYSEEEEGATIDIVEADSSKFVGAWTCTSEKAEYLYGDIELTVNSDNTWSGIITDENLEGTWELDGDKMHMNSELFSFDLAYSNTGNLLMIETQSDGDIVTVLTAK